MKDSLVAICTVTQNAAADLPRYLQALERLAHRPLEVIVVDCASTDSTVETLARASIQGANLRVIELEENVGFANGMNRALAASSAPFALSLNADALPATDYVGRLLARFESHPELRVGAVTGRLSRFRSGDEPAVLDAAGMRLTLNWRHHDRGSSEPDVGQYDRAERVFGGTGAATLFFRPALEDAAIDGEVFLDEFHSFREDAELSFRLRERGWEILYEPRAIASHRRHNLPGRRSAMPDHVNLHSVKNRFLLRAYHETWASFMVTLGFPLVRDLAVIAYVLLREHSSRPALTWLWKNRRHVLRRRRHIQERVRVPRRRLAAWFLRSGQPL